MLAQHHLVPDAHQLKTAHLDQAQPLYIADLCRYSRWTWHGTIEAARLFESRRFGLGWKDKMTYALQFAQCLDSAPDLWATARIVKVEVQANCFAHRGTILMGLGAEYGAHDFD